MNARLADDRSLEVLDFDAIRLMVAKATSTEGAAERARTMVPHTDLARVRLEQGATVEMRRIANDGAFDLPRTYDVSDALARAERGGTLGPEELRDVGFALAAADAAVRRVRASATPILQARCAAATPLPEVAAAIDRAIGERGEVLDRASTLLARIRRNAAHAQEEARERLQSVLRSPRYAKAIQDPLVTMREGRFVVPVKAEFANALPGVVHDTSSTGHTLFVEPLDALEANNRLRTLRFDEEHEIGRILAELSSLVGSRAQRAVANLEALADIDFVLARVRVAQAMDAVAPVMLDRPYVEIRRGRHPLISGRVVPQSLALDENTRMIVISGPNMGGKTVALKLVGLFVSMAYCGMQLPADEGTAIGTFDFLGCDIGDEQSIAGNASTFSAHLRRLRTLVESAGPHALILIDEIASGTEPGASAALATAVVEYLLERGTRGIVTTHSTELKLFAHNTSQVVNGSVRFDPETYAPTYELDLGSPGQSLAFPLARTMGLPGEIVARAEALLSTSERDYDRALEELSVVRSQAAAERDALVRERAAIAGVEAAARERADALERERRTLARTADERLSRALRDFTAELQRRNADRIGGGRGKVTSGQASLLGRAIENVQREIGFEQQSQPAPAARTAPGSGPIAVGDRVHVPSLGSEGEVAEDYGRTILVAIGSMKTVVAKKDVRIVRRARGPQPSVSQRPRPRASERSDDGDRDASASFEHGGATGERNGSGDGGQAQLEAATVARTEIDVRGKRFTEAEPIVDKWIDESALAGMSPLRLIHGKGTGLLGRGLQEWLKGRPGIRDVRYGNANEGGSGVTIFELA
jgi:DNA mismatch repair protein MutS2